MSVRLGKKRKIGAMFSVELLDEKGEVIATLVAENKVWLKMFVGTIRLHLGSYFSPGNYTTSPVRRSLASDRMFHALYWSPIGPVKPGDVACAFLGMCSDKEGADRLLARIITGGPRGVRELPRCEPPVRRRDRYA